MQKKNIINSLSIKNASKRFGTIAFWTEKTSFFQNHFQILYKKFFQDTNDKERKDDTDLPKL